MYLACICTDIIIDILVLTFASTTAIFHSRLCSFSPSYTDIGVLPVLSDVLTVALDPSGAQRLLLHAEQVSGPGVHLVQRPRIHWLLQNKNIQTQFCIKETLVQF